MTATRVVIVDDHPLFREGVAGALSGMGFEIVGEGCSKDDAIYLAEQQQPDILLLDISMPGGGLETIQPVLSTNASQKIVFLTVSESAEDAAKALNAGAKGYVLKGVGAKSLGDILKSVVKGETYVSPTLAARMLADLQTLSSKETYTSPLETLTARELEILELVALGMSNKRIALQLRLQEKTVKYHMTKVLSKLKAQNRTAAAMVFRGTQLAAVT